MVRDAPEGGAPHHESLGPCREDRPHPEGPPEAGVSKDGSKEDLVEVAVASDLVTPQPAALGSCAAGAPPPRTWIAPSFTSATLRVWKASSVERWPIETMVACGSFSVSRR